VDPNACPDPLEQKRKDKFKARTDMRLLNHIPSTGIGKYDTAYFPSTGAMPVIVRIHFQFTDAAGAPTGWDLFLRRLRGQDVSSMIWDAAQKRDYISQFTTRIRSRWSAKHTIRSVKPCWNFTALPDIRVMVVPFKAAAHFAVTVHKSTGPGIDYKSAVNNEHLLNPKSQPTADFYQSDNREEPNFNSGSVATTERQRIDAAITAAGASRLLFEVNSDALKPGAAAALSKLAGSLNAALPSAPLIPIQVDGFASADGKAAFNTDLAKKRADSAAKALTDAGVRQPVRATGRGPVGAPHDANNRAATVAADRTFETTYASNRYSVSEHEFGHMLGNPDEYSNAAVGTPLGGVQTRYSGLVTTAGLTVPTFGQNTSSQMSAGVDVLPEHYITLWEALAKMTSPDLGQADWSLR
jgi:outer membrane protein OmpA-like peptidoglycan-associated protein